jgi:hypothetical protein
MAEPYRILEQPAIYLANNRPPLAAFNSGIEVRTLLAESVPRQGHAALAAL